ncbi:MAG: nuclear transport factor 2 family protein [Flavobacteriaceae bacterium]|nr:nuclear transport factor 2 family protein [Flavobacteriaceae bacterium]
MSGGISAQGEPKEEIKKVIQHFFNGLQTGDTISIKETLADKVVLQTAFNKEGESILRTDDFDKFLNAIGSKTPEDIWVEKLLSYTIQVDGNMANVWTPYEFYYNNKFSHCGVNSFQLFHNGEAWKIIYLMDTRRKEDCKTE